MKVVDDIINLESQHVIRNLLLSDFPWFFNYSNVKDYNIQVNDSNAESNPQFTHLFYLKGEQRTIDYNMEIIKPLFNAIDEKFNLPFTMLFQCRANMLLSSASENYYNMPHTDSDRKTTSIVYYVNDTDGDTIIFKENLESYKNTLNIDMRVSPKMGRAVCFDSSFYHTSTCPKKNKFRTIINLVYIQD